MSWTNIIWSMIAGICLTLAAVHFLLWLQERAARMNLAFAMWASTVAITALFELAMMQARTPGQYGELVRWFHLPLAVLTVTYLWFIVLYLRAGRRWLQLLIYGVVALRLVINFSSDSNLNFSEITTLKHVALWGESVAAPIGVRSRWQWLDEVGWVLTILFSVDAVAGAWRRGRRRQSTVMGACVVITNALTIGLASMTVHGTSPLPVTVSLPTLLIITVMAYELSVDLLRVQKVSRELSESQERMRLAADAADLSLWEWDIANDEIWVTEAGRARVGAGEKEKLGFDRFLQSIHPDDRETVRTYVQHAVESLGDLAIEYRVIAPDGAVQWISGHGHVERNVSGKAVRVRGVTVDITDRKHAETERVQLRLELAHLNRVLTMNELSSSLAHEINQPLGAILNNASAAKVLHARCKEGEGGEVGEILDDIIADTNRAGQIVRKIRGIIRKESVPFEPLDMNTLIGEILELFGNSLIRERITVREELSPDLLPVRGDRIGLQQVVMNLIMNSTDAMKGSSNRVLTIRSAMQGPDRVNVSISDTGPGIDEKMKDRLFSPFATTKKEGLGMGLRICRSIVGDHGGSIRAENHAGEGATFSFTLKADSGGSA